MTNEKHGNHILVFGFMLFATFFGAGNLIFPPYLGIVSGPQWLIGFIGFTVADAGLALLAVMAIAKYEGDLFSLFAKSGKFMAYLLCIIDILCIGPLIVIPRTGATTYEMGMLPIFGNGFLPRPVFAVIFFVITYILTIRPSKVVDIIGKVLTPILIISLAVIIIKGIISPLGTIVDKPMIPEVFSKGIKDGYQTMDCFVPLAIGGVLISSLQDKGFTKIHDQIKMLSKAGIVASIGLCLVYGGLCYLGATVSKKYGVDAVQSQVIVNIAAALLGTVGKVVLGIVVSFACLTTSIGLTSGSAKVFSKLSGGRLTYEKLVIAICVLAACMASIDVSGIIKVASPILDIVYPPSIVLIVLSFFKEKIKNRNVYIFSTYAALIIGALTVFSTKVPAFDIVNHIPLAKFGFNWVIPVIIVGIIGNFIPHKGDEAKVSM